LRILRDKCPIQAGVTGDVQYQWRYSTHLAIC
jgi:hypothetical protein